MKVSVRKISKITGFSPATVSNALNFKKGVKRETSEIILKTAEELGYKLNTKVTKIRFVIFRRNGLIIDDSPFHPSVIEGVERAATANGYETVFCYVDINSSDYNDQITEILNDTESAIILLGTEMVEESDFEPYVKSRNKIILLDGWNDKYFFNGVLISNTDSACRAIEYLVEKGHKEIGYIRGDFRIQAFKYREIGYRRVMDKYNLPVNENHIATIGTKTVSAYEGMKEYLDKNKDLPTAYFAENDTIAIGAMQALKEFGYDIPRDVSIIGFDNIAYGAISDPPLTTINVFKKEMGETAVRELIYMLNEESDTSLKIQVCTSFVERGSVKEI